MKRFIPLAALLLATPAMAQQPNYTPTSEVLLRQALSCETVAGNQIVQLQQELAAATKERDALKVTAAKAADPAATVAPAK